MQNNRSSSSDRPSPVFHGIRFVLLGFDPAKKSEVLRKLVNGGGVDAGGHYGPNCTHLIVDKLAYDDPICVAARRDGKILVSGLWVDHSFDVGVPVDATSVMYKPVKDLNGIPGAKSLVICLTGYQREDREDIMTMVDQMGAQFSKPLIANKVTHLICYKFEGEKYLLAKKMKRIKLINHRWLEDCLKAWEIISEADYSKSGYELEMEAEAKDSEEEAEGFAARRNEGKMASPHHSLMLKQDATRSQPNTSASKRLGNAADMVSATIKSISDQISNAHEIKSNHPLVPGFSNTNVIGVTCEPSKVFEGTVSGSAAQNSSDAASTAANKSPLDETGKVISASYSRKVPRISSPAIDLTSNTGSAKRLSKLNFSEAFNTSSSSVEKVNDGSENALAGLRTPCNAPALCLEEDQNGSSTGKRKMDISSGSSKLQRTSHNDGTPNRGSTHVWSSFQELEKHPPAERSNQLSPLSYLNDRAAVSPPGNPPSNVTGRKSSSSKGKSVNGDVPIYKTSASEFVQGEDLDAVQRPLKESSEPSSVTKCNNRDVDMVQSECGMPGAQKLEQGMQGLEESSPSAVRLDLEKSSTTSLEINERSAGSNPKPVKRKSVGKKFSAPNQSLGTKKTVSQKGSIYLKISEPKNNATTATVDVQGLADDENLLKCQMFEEVPPAAKPGPKMGMNDDLQIENMSGNKFSYLDDETEPPEDKEEAGKENHKDGEPEKAVDMMIDDVAQNNDKDADITASENLDKVLVEKSDDTRNAVNDKASKGKKLPVTKKAKKRTALSVKEVTDKKAAKKKELAIDNNNSKPEVREEVTPLRTGKTKRKVNDLENSVELERAEGVRNDPEHTSDEKHDDGAEHVNSPSNVDDVQAEKSADTENIVNKKAAKKSRQLPSKTKKDAALSVKEVTDTKAVKKKGKPTSSRTVKTPDMEAQKENREIPVDQSASNKQVLKFATELPEKINQKFNQANKDPITESLSKAEPMWFILSGHKLQRREFQQIIRRLKGRVCRVSHQWSYQATHFIVPDPMRRTEKFFAAAASGRWILKTDYLSASNEAGRFLAEEPYEWHRSGLSEDGQINMEAPRKWRLLKEKTGHGAFYGMRIIIYGECIAPPLDTLKRAVKAGDGTILATSPPYTRFLNGGGVDFAVVSPGMPHVDIWVQEFLTHEIPCISADYLVEYVCKPGYPLEKHVQYDTNVWAERSYNNLKTRLTEETSEVRTPDSNDVACEVCGLHDRGDEMLICGNESGSSGCGCGTHIDCCDLPLADVPEEDWFCPKCRKISKSGAKKGSKRKGK